MEVPDVYSSDVGKLSMIINIRLWFIVSNSVARSRTVYLKCCGLYELCMSAGCLLFVGKSVV